MLRLFFGKSVFITVIKLCMFLLLFIAEIADFLLKGVNLLRLTLLFALVFAFCNLFISI